MIKRPEAIIQASKVDLRDHKMLFMKIANRYTNGSFVIDDRNKAIVQAMFLYFLNQPGSLDRRKGLWIAGPVGTGKSTLMYIFSKFMQILQFGFKVYICSQVATEFSLTGGLDKYLLNSNGYIRGPAEMCFDELGREPIPAKYYGTELNVMQHILHIRYSYWQLYGLKTYITTNFFPDDVQNKYGEYIRDRRAEMFNLIELSGESRRL